MHELSLVTSIVETVTETLADHPGARVKEVRLRVGALASVIPESLEFCWGIVSEGTPLEASRLVVDLLPVVVHCERCAQDATLEGVQSFRCPRCNEICGEIRQGRELEIDSIEIDDPEEGA
ncbi:MAG: hydrogenase maturation nickel metallochaperone HypA [Terracidiphilus sp.]